MPETTYFIDRVEHFPNNSVTYYRRQEEYSKAMTKAKEVHDAHNTKNFVKYILSFE
jgi:hypothetical protein